MPITKAGTKSFLWAEGDLTWKLHSTQRVIDAAVKASDASEILVLSSRQLGKSWWALCYALEYLINNPGTIVRFLAPKKDQIGDIIADNLGPIMQNAPEGLIERQKSDHRWRVGQSSLRIGALERAHVDNNRGGNASLIICEEGAFVNSDDYIYAVRQVIGPQLLRSGGKLIHVTSVNKDDPLHYVHTELKAKTQLTKSCFSYTIYDNPQLTSEQIEKAKFDCGGASSPAWLAEYLNEIVRSEETVVVPTFDKLAHVREFVLPDYSNYQVTIDFGGVRDKTCALLHTYDFERNKYLWVDERFFDANTPTDVIIKGVREMEQGFAIDSRWADCPGQLQIDLDQAGYSITPPPKDDWKAQINALQIAFGQDRMEVHPRCKMLIQTLESGRFNKQKTDFERSSVLGHCDALAAMGYGFRVSSRENPFPHVTPDRDHYLSHKVHKTALEIASEMMVPKVFSGNFNGVIGGKKFGAFRK